MTMNNEYWAERFLLLNEMLLQKGEAYQKQLEEVYAMVFLSIEKEINDFYNRFAKNNAITFQEAKTLLDSRQREAFQMTLQEYIQYGSMEGVDEKWLKKLENASTVHRITMLQAIQYQLQHHAERLTAKKAEGLTKALKEIYKEGYYRTAYTMQINNPFAKIDENKIEKVLSRPWSPDGKNFSQRIWGSDRSNLIHQLNTRFTQGIIRGEAREKIIKDMKKALNSSAQATKRLVLTESAFVASASRKDCFEQLGVEKYQFLATLDLKTSVICQDMDGKVFERKDYQIGVTAPPMHPHCRSTTVPYFDDTLTQTEQRAARGEDGKTYYVPADMTYKQWYEKYVKSIEKSTGYQYNKDGTVIITDDWKNQGKVTIPREYKPFAIIETVETKGGVTQINRNFYDSNGFLSKQIHTGNHGNSKNHPYGKNGEHIHNYKWKQNSKKPERTTKELSKQDRIENADIL